MKNIIKDRRQSLGLTMKYVADAVGVSEATVSRWESGDIADMKRNRIINLAKVLQISPLDILDLPAETKQPTETDGLSEEEALMIQVYRSLPEAHRQALLAQVRALIPFQQAPDDHA